MLAKSLAPLVALAFGVRAIGADAVVSKDDYEKLRKEHEELKKEMKELRDWKAQMQGTRTAAPSAAATGRADEAKDTAGGALFGSTKMLLTGYGAAGFTERRHGDDGFSAQFNPILLWKLSDKLFFEGEVELELEEHATNTKLELASMYYVANDYLTLGAGKFLNPTNEFIGLRNLPAPRVR